MRILVSGSTGLLGWHACAHIHALNRAAQYAQLEKPFELIKVDRETFQKHDELTNCLRGTEVVLHFAGRNRGSDSQIERDNIEIAEKLIDACKSSGTIPHIVYANTIHADADTAYGKSKKAAGKLLEDFADLFTNLSLPHIFGEAALPDYNNVTATLIDRVITDKPAYINPDGRVSLLHAGDAVERAIECAIERITGNIEFDTVGLSIADLFERILDIHNTYRKNTFPEFSSGFDLKLFNCYRNALYPNSCPRALEIIKDERGTLFEALKTKGRGQVFLSWTEPGVTRGNHFHLRKIERFLVLEGNAIIRIRKVLDGHIDSYNVSGENPSIVDIPNLHTHSIENTGSKPLLTMFWTNEFFDQNAPDTYSDTVIEEI